jgi:hypothetical protein
MEFPELSKGNRVNVNLNMFTMFKTPTLSESLRTGYNVKSKNIDIIRAYRQQYDYILAHTPDDQMASTVRNYIANEAINLEYTEENGELIGDKLTDSIQKADIDKIIAKNPTTPEGKPEKIGIIVSNLEGPLTRLVKEYPNWENLFDIKTPDRVQGLEYQYVAIDVDTTNVGGMNVNSAIRALEMLYTMTTRSKKGSIIDNKIVNGMSLNSSDKDVFAVRTQLDGGIIEAYKKFRLDSINYVLGQVGESAFNTKSVVPIKAQPTALKSRTMITTPDEETKFLELVEKRGQGEDDNYAPANSAGDSIPLTDPAKPLTYPFHERLQVMTDNNDKVWSVKSDSKDLGFFYKVINPDGTLTGKPMEDDNVVAARQSLKVFKNALYNYSNYRANPANKLSLGDYFSRYTSLHSDLLDKIDFDNIKIGVESKLYEPNNDSDKGAAPYESGGGGISHWMIARIPLEDGTVGEVTLAAFPNKGNTNVASLEGVMKNLTLLDTRFKEAQSAAKGDGTFTTFTPIQSQLNIEDVLKPTSNSIIKNGTIQNLEEMIANNPHLKFSPVHILTNSKMFDQGEDDTVGLAIKNLVGQTRDEAGTLNKYDCKLMGRAVVYVTYDVTKAENTLVTEFQHQFIDSIRNGSDPANRETQDTIKMIPLNTTGLTLTELIQKNKEIAYNLGSELDLDSKVQRLAYGNKFLAARILNSIYNTDIFIKRQIANNNFDAIRGTLRLDGVKYTDEVIRDMSDRNTSLIANVLQILGTTDSKLTIREPQPGVLAGIAKKYYSEIVQAAASESDGVSKAFPKAAAHYYTKQLLDAIAGTMNENGFVVDNSILRTLEDNNGNKMFLEFHHSEPFNVLIALRASLEGGRWQTPSGLKGSPGLFDFSSGDVKQNYYDFLDKMLLKEFPQGLYINPVIRKATDENELPDGLLSYPAGNPTRHFTIDAKITEFNSLFDVGQLELRSQQEISVDTDEHKAVLSSIFDKLKSDINTNIAGSVSDLTLSALRDHVFNEFGTLAHQSSTGDIKYAAENPTATINNILKGMKGIVDDSSSKNKLIDTPTGLSILKDSTIVDGDHLAIDSTPYDTALEKQLNDIADSNGIPREDLTVSHSGISKDSPINYVVENNKTNERIAKFVFSEGEFKHVVTDTPDSQLGVVKDTAYHNLIGLNNELVGSVHDFVRDDVSDFFDHISNIRDQGASSNVDVDTQLKLGKNYLMIAASLTGNNKGKLLETFNEAYKDFIEHYKC